MKKIKQVTILALLLVSLFSCKKESYKNGDFKLPEPTVSIIENGDPYAKNAAKINDPITMDNVTLTANLTYNSIYIYFQWVNIFGNNNHGGGTYAITTNGSTLGQSPSGFGSTALWKNAKIVSWSNIKNSPVIVFTLTGTYSYLMPIRADVTQIDNDVTIVIEYNTQTHASIIRTTLNPHFH